MYPSLENSTTGNAIPYRYARNMPSLGLEGAFYDDIFAGYYIRRQVYFNALAGLKKGGDGVEHYCSIWYITLAGNYDIT